MKNMVFQERWISAKYGLHQNEVDPNIYYKNFGTYLLILVLYVDDLFLVGAKKFIAGCKADMATKLKIDIDMMHYFLGLEVWQTRGKFPYVG
jgi:hypothetical protein